MAAIRTLSRCASALTGSPCLRSALPPKATTISIASSSLGQRGDKDRLDRMQAVFSLLEDDRGIRLEHVVRDFDAVQETKFIADLLADLGLRIVQGGQAMHKFHARIAGCRKQRRVDLEWQQFLDSLAPFLERFA